MEKTHRPNPMIEYRKRYDLAEFEMIAFQRSKAHRASTEAIYSILLYHLENISPVIDYPARTPLDVIRISLEPTNPPGCYQIRLQRYDLEHDKVIKDLGWIWDLLPEFINDFEDLVKWVLCQEAGYDKEAHLLFYNCPF